MLRFLLAVADVAADPTVQRTFWEWVLMVAGGITAVSGAGAILWKVAVRPHLQEFVRKASEVHTSVTVNGGKNSPPTLRDDISDLRAQVGQLVVAAGATAQRTSDLGDRLDDLHSLVVDTREDLARHEDSGRKYLGQVEVVLRDKGIELPPAN